MLLKHPVDHAEPLHRVLGGHDVDHAVLAAVQAHAVLGSGLQRGGEELLEGLSAQTAPKWLEVDKNGSAKVGAMPERDDIDFEFEEQLIVELYSK